MKKIIITILCICLADIPLMAEVRLMNTTNILRNYGFKNGNFDSTADVALETAIDANVKYGSIEEDDFIDTTEEFLTATYYSPIKITPKAQAAIDKELPKGREGALRLGAMWLIKLAEEPENDLQYKKAIDMICAQSNVTRAEIDKYYAEAIRKKIYETPIDKVLTKDEQAQVRELFLAYMLNPTDKRMNEEFLKYVIRLKFSTFPSSFKKVEPSLKFVEKISPSLSLYMRIFLVVGTGDKGFMGNE